MVRESMTRNSRTPIGLAAIISMLAACSADDAGHSETQDNKSSSGLEKSVYLNEGDGFTIDSAHVVTVAQYGPPDDLSQSIVRKEMFVEAYGDRTGIIETRTTRERNPSQREERVMIIKTYIADGKQYTETTRQRRMLDGEIVDPGTTGPVLTEDFDPIWDSVASTLMLTGIEKAPVGYSDGGSKEVAGVTCKLWIRDTPPGEDCVWRGFDIYGGTLSEDTGEMVDVLTTEYLELDVSIPKDLVRLSQ